MFLYCTNYNFWCSGRDDIKNNSFLKSFNNFFIMFFECSFHYIKILNVPVQLCEHDQVKM